MPKGPRKLVITFGNQTLTHYGGVYLLHRFLTRIGLKNAIATEIRFIQRNKRYTVGELLLAILYPIILGLERIETTQSTPTGYARRWHTRNCLETCSA